MSAAKAASKSKQAGSRWPGLAARLILRRAVLGPLVIVLALGAVAYTAWKSVESHVLSSEDYQIDPAQIVVTPTMPKWIRSDVRGEVLRDAHLDEPLSILSDGLAERVAQAFQLHPWVARVIGVRKVLPAGLEVEVEYRRPVCMVEVAGGLYAVDDRGVLLPSADFSPAEARRYPRLSAPQRPFVSPGPPGTPWQDVRIAGAAKIAAELLEAWDELYLNRVAPSLEQGEPFPGQPNEYDLYTARGTRIRWGRPPDAPAPGEPTAQKKLAALRAFAVEHDGLDGPDGPQDLDVRQGSVVATPRVAAGSTIDGGEKMKQ